MKAAILVGGLGTRLRPIIGDCPKPLALVRGRPFLAYLLEWLRAQGYLDVVLCVGYRWQDIQAIFGNGSSVGMRLEYSVEEKPLGTAGALKHAADHLPGTFLALNGDSIVDADLADLVRFHYETQALATLALAAVPDARRYGLVECDSRRRVTAFEEKSSVLAANQTWVNAGVYVLEPQVLDYIPENRAVSLERETFPLLLQTRVPVMGYTLEGKLLDIGTPESYLRSQSDFRGIIG